MGFEVGSSGGLVGFGGTWGAGEELEGAQGWGGLECQGVLGVGMGLGGDQRGLGGSGVVREGYGVWGVWGDQRHLVGLGSVGRLWGLGWKRVPGGLWGLGVRHGRESRGDQEGLRGLGQQRVPGGGG